MDEDAHTFLLQAEPLISARTQIGYLIWNSGAIPIRQYATMTPLTFLAFLALSLDS